MTSNFPDPKVKEYIEAIQRNVPGYTETWCAFGNKNLGDSEAKTIARALCSEGNGGYGNTKLQVLDLQGNQISDVGAES